MEFIYASERSVSEIADLLAASFEGYIVNIPFSVPLLLSLMRTEGIDLAASRIIQENGRDAGIAIICRRGAESRVAAFGIVAAARGRGLGKALVDQTILDAKSREEHRIVLECIEQNPSALHLYEGKGFVRLRRLVGFSAPTVPEIPHSYLNPVPIAEAAYAIARANLSDLPWQISPASLLQASLPNVAYQLGPSHAILVPTPGGIQLRAIVTDPSAQKQGHGRRLIQAIAAHYPNQAWNISPLWPEENVTTFLNPLGFTHAPISQWLLEFPLAS